MGNIKKSLVAVVVLLVFGWGIVNTYAKRPSQHDVAITVIDAPHQVYEGDLATVSVTVKNQGRYAETTTLSLTDETDAVLIGFQQVSLDVGDSIIGRNCNFGAGTLVANLKFDNSNVQVRINGTKIDSGRRKLGVFMADDTKTSINLSLMQGTVTPKGSRLLIKARITTEYLEK